MENQSISIKKKKIKKIKKKNLTQTQQKFSDFDDQADMCEIVRAMIAGGVIEGAKLDELNDSVVDAIDCPGESDEGKKFKNKDFN